MVGYRIPNIPYFVSRQRYESYLRSLGSTVEEEKKFEQSIAYQPNRLIRADMRRRRQEALNRQAVQRANRLRISSIPSDEFKYSIELTADLIYPTEIVASQPYSFYSGTDLLYYTSIRRFGYPYSTLRYRVNTRDEEWDNVIYFTKSILIYANKPVAGFTREQMNGHFQKYFSRSALGYPYWLRGMESTILYDAQPIGNRRLYGSIMPSKPSVIDVNVEEDLLSKDCVVRVIQEHIKKSKFKYLNSMRESTLLEELGMTDRTEGCVLDNLIAFCTKYKIEFKLCDVGFNIIQSLTFPTKQRGIYAMVRDNHLYHIKTSSTINKIFRNKKLDEHEKDRSNKKQFCDICMVDIDDMHSHYFDVHEKREKVQIDAVASSLFKYMKDENKIPLMNYNLDGFSDGKTVYHIAKNRSQTIGLDIMNKLHGDKYLSSRTEETKFLFDNTITTFNKSYITKPTMGFTYDIKRQFASICAKIRFPVYNSYCKREVFKGNFSEATFYNIDNASGSTWQCMQLTKFLLDNNMIAISDIKYELVPSRIIDLESFVEEVYTDNKFTDHERKDIINLTLGCFAKTKGEIKNQPSIIDNDLDAKYLYNKPLEKDTKLSVKIMSNIEKLQGGIILNNGEEMDIDDYLNNQKTTIIRVFQTVHNYNLMMSAKPIYSYLISYSRFIMMNAKKQAEACGAKVLSIRTDSISTDKEVKLDKIISHDKIGMWKDPVYEIINVINYNEKDGVKDIEYEEKQWQPITMISNTNSQLITGMPGCGKSFMAQQLRSAIQRITEEVRKSGKHTKKSNVCWMTFQNNIASNVEDGYTFHKKLGIKLGTSITTARLRKRFTGVEYTFVDEVQQTPSEVMQHLIWLKSNMNIKFICMGDFDQFGSISDSNYDINSPSLKLLCDNNILHVKGNKRIQDKVYVEALLSNMGLAIDIVSKNQNLDPKYTITFFSDNKFKASAGNINIEQYEKYNKVNYSNEFEIFEGLPLISLKSDAKKGIVKGVHLDVVGLDDDFIYLRKSPEFHDTDCNIIRVEKRKQNTTDIVKTITRGKNKGKEITKEYKYDFYECFGLGYAFTCHKTIGLTIKAPYTVIDNCPCDNKKYLYVALSRCNDPKQIKYVKPTKPKSVFDIYTLEYLENVADHMVEKYGLNDASVALDMLESRSGFAYVRDYLN